MCAAVVVGVLHQDSLKGSQSYVCLPVTALVGVLVLEWKFSL